MRVLITGGAGFIGHHVVEHILRNTKCEIVLLDRLDVSGNLNRIAEVLSQKLNWVSRVKWVYHDLKAPINETISERIGHVDAIFHMGASTHVDRSIVDPMSFVYDNVVGTGNLLWWLKQYGVGDEKLIYFSTDEVFGPAAEEDAFKEWDRYNSTNPYSATKAGAEELCLAFSNTYGLDIRIVHCMNVFGERQHREKFIPLVMKKVLNDEVVYIHANKDRTYAGSRFYIHARNVADAVLFVLVFGKKRDKYNIVGSKEIDNLSLALLIAGYIEKPLKYELIDFHSSRPGHDLRYALDGEKLKEMGWVQPINFEVSLQRTIKWTLQHLYWL